MGSYFSTLMKHYGPDDASAAVMPDVPDPTDQEPRPAAAPIQRPPDPVAEVLPDPPPKPAPAVEANFFQQTSAPGPVDPPDFSRVHLTSDSAPPPSERIITEVTERVIHETPRPIPEVTDTPDVPPPMETHMHETHQTDVHLTETHVHEAILPPSDDMELTPPEPTKSAEIHDQGAPQTEGQESMLDALELHLEKAFANLTNPQKPPTVCIVGNTDFEPDGTDLMPPLQSEEIREVTREIVKEIHHHHHETKRGPEKAPAPRTAESASQIGPIRLSSDWGIS